jgi:hypothetical protein
VNSEEVALGMNSLPRCGMRREHKPIRITEEMITNILLSRIFERNFEYHLN